MSNYFLGLDNGGTITKAVLFDSTGKELHRAATKVTVLNPQQGYTERDMEELWQANCTVLREVISKAKIDPHLIKGIACTGHGKGLYLWSKDGKPAYKGIISTDARATDYAEKWSQDGTADKAFAKTYQRLLACQPACILAWFRDHEAQVLENTQWVFSVKDYIRFRLTGEAYSEITDCSGTSLLNLHTRNFDDELLELFNLQCIRDKLPPLRGSSENCGCVTKAAAEQTGLAEGTILAGGMFDIDACALALGITDEENICVIAGTWSINEYISQTPVLDKSVMMNSCYAIEPYYLIEECSPTSASNNEWFLNLFMPQEKEIAQQRNISLYEYANELVNSTQSSDVTTIFLPYIFGSNYNPRAQACFIGMDSRTTRAQLLRAVYEGVCFCHKVHIEKLLASRTKPVAAIRLAGGVANSLVWAQMFADVLGLPVELIATQELGALGCAMTSAVCVSCYPDYTSAAQKMVHVAQRLEPNPAMCVTYTNKYQRYKMVSEKLDSIWTN